MYKRFSLMAKTLVIAVLAAGVVWFLLDQYQSRIIRKVFLSYLDKTLTEKAGLDRRHFDRYLNFHVTALKVIVSQKKLYDYLSVQENIHSLSAKDPVYWNKYPPWFPSRSTLRTLIVIRHAVLFDENYNALEVFQGRGESALPRQFLSPSTLILEESNHQVYMTEIDKFPFAIRSMPVQFSADSKKYTIMLIAPLDDQFLQDSHVTTHQNNLVALFDMDRLTVLASDHPDVLPQGASISSVEKEYKIIGKSFFDRGGSTLQVQFSSLLAKDEYLELSNAFLNLERKSRAILALVLITILTGIIYWITRKIHAFTENIFHVAKESEITISSASHVDEFLMLEDSFSSFSAEILQSRQVLKSEKEILEQTQRELLNKTKEINAHREKLQGALDNISNLIRQTTTKGTFSVRFENENLTKCYTVLIWLTLSRLNTPSPLLFFVKKKFVFLSAHNQRRDHHVSTVDHSDMLGLVTV